jgi:membrane protease YdiL (CAAX protease family)
MPVKSRLIPIFFIATFLWTWACYLPIVLSGHSPYQMPWIILLIVGGAGPSIIGVAIALFAYDKADRRDFWVRCFSLKRIGRIWWLVIFLLPPAASWAAIGFDLALGGSLPGMDQLRFLMASPSIWPFMVLISFMSGPWSEEFGWRGVALRPLIARFGILWGTVLLGAIWGIWHLPLFFMPATWHGQLGFGLTGFWMFMAYSVALVLLMTWVFDQTNSSILSAMLLHFTANFTSQLLVPVSDRVEVGRMLIMFMLGLAACLWLRYHASTPELEYAQ